MRERGRRFRASGTASREPETGEGGIARGGDGVYLLPRSLRSVADAPKDGAWGKIGHSGRDDKRRSCDWSNARNSSASARGAVKESSSDRARGRSAALKGVGGDFGVAGGPVVGRERDAPEFGGGFEEFDADFDFAFGGGSDVDDADELLFERFSVAEKDFLADLDAHGHEDQGTVGVDVGGEGVFGDVLFIGAAGDDEDGEAQQDALAAAAVMRGSGVGERIGH
jgi:hypothetical protein